MLLACFTSFVTCYLSTLRCFIEFFVTNLLTRCRSSSCLFLLFLVSENLVKKYSQNWTKQKPNFLFFQSLHGVQEETKRGTRVGSPCPGAAPLLAAPRGGEAHQGVHRPHPFSYLKLPMENPKYPIKNQQKVPQPPSSSTLDREGSEAVPGALLERRIITGGLYIAMPSSGLMSE